MFGPQHRLLARRKGFQRVFSDAKAVMDLRHRVRVEVEYCVSARRRRAVIHPDRRPDVHAGRRGKIADPS